MPKYTEAEVNELKRLFYEYETLEYIAPQINKSLGSVTQKVRQLKLKRNLHTVRMVTVYGHDILRHGKTPEAIRAGLAKAHTLEKAQKAKERITTQKAAVAWLKKQLATGTMRNPVIIEAKSRGALLHQIADVVGLTKAGVGLIVTPPKPKKDDPWNR